MNTTPTLPVLKPGAALPNLAERLVIARPAPQVPSGALAFQARDPKLAPPLARAPLLTGELPASTSAEQWWAANGPALMAIFRAGGAAGSCTDFAATYRPDIVEDYQEWLYDHFGQSAAQAMSWVAWQWVYNAYYCGHSIGWWPAVNSVICFQPGQLGAGIPTGHVGIVEAVGSDNSFIISEMNFTEANGSGGKGIVSYRWFSAQTAVAIAQGFPQVAFIY